MTLKSLISVFFLVALSSCGQPFNFPAPFPEPTGPYAVTGTVYNGAGPATLSGAKVQLKGPVNRSMTTTSAGTYAFGGLPEGEYRVEVSLEGFYVYPHGINVDSRIYINGIMTKDFRSVSGFNPVGKSFTIPEIQGRSHISSLVGQQVTNVVGVVTGTEIQKSFKLDTPWRGLYLQNPYPDGDERTSEGIFVYIPLQDTSFSVAVGSLVNIKSGVVQENRNDFSFLDSAYSGNLSRTTVVTNKDNVEILLSGSGLTDPKIPPAVLVGVTPAAGKRIIPPVHSEIAGDVESSSWDFDPKRNAVDFWESLEGMRVQMDNMQVVEAKSEYEDVFVSPDNGVGIVATTDQGGALLSNYSENNARVVQVAEYVHTYPTAYATLPDVGTGGLLTTTTGIVEYSRNTYLVRALSFGTASVVGVTAQETTTLTGDASHLTVATKNLENFWAGDNRASGLGTVISARMQKPDIVGLVEVQDNNGEQDDGTVAADLSLDALITAIGGSPPYQARQVDPRNNRNGGAPGANIRTAFIFRPNRVTFIDRPANSVDPSINSVQVVAGTSGPELSWSPGLIGAGEAIFDYTRKPLVGEFLFNGKKIFVIVVHLNSKRGDGSFWGPLQPIKRPSETKRHQLALAVANFVREIKALDANANVVVVGDFNDFHFSRTLTLFEEAGLYNLHRLNPEGERYTYIHLGNSQTLDHILVSNNLVSGAALDVVRVYRNITYNQSQSLSDHEPVVSKIYLP